MEIRDEPQDDRAMSTSVTILIGARAGDLWTHNTSSTTTSSGRPVIPLVLAVPLYHFLRLFIVHENIITFYKSPLSDV